MKKYGISKIMSAHNNEYSNPGQQLRFILETLYPVNLNESNNFLSKLDHAFASDNKFVQLVYESSINYIVRRLINTAESLKRKFYNSDYPPEKYQKEIRVFLKEYTHIPENQIERIFILLLECLKARDKKPNDTDRRMLLKSAEKNNLRCYICGCDLNFREKEQEESAELEHEWPRALGGSSDPFNLRISCLRCNKIKSDYIDSTDFHYEKISLLNEIQDASFFKELKREYRVALWLKSECKCVVCGKQASSEGQLQFARREPNDSWHFINIEAYCDRHHPK